MGAMASTPLAIALLQVNVGFLGFAGYVLGEVAEGARTRNATQMELRSRSCVTDIRDQAGKVRSRTTFIGDYPPSGELTHDRRALLSARPLHHRLRTDLVRL